MLTCSYDKEYQTINVYYKDDSGLTVYFYGPINHEDRQLPTNDELACIKDRLINKDMFLTDLFEHFFVYETGESVCIMLKNGYISFMSGRLGHCQIDLPLEDENIRKGAIDILSLMMELSRFF